MGTLDEAHSLLAGLEATESRAAFDELTHWLQSFGAAEGFTPGRRARILLVINEHVRLHWRELARRYLAPEGEPSEFRDGDPGLLLAMLDLSEALATAFAACFAEGQPDSDWLKRNAALILVTWMRALVRRATLRRMLRLPLDESTWPVLHGIYRRAVNWKVDARPIAAYPDEKRLTSVRQEYVRGALIGLASLDSLKVREMELVFRIAGRYAAAVQLIETDGPGVVYGMNPQGDTGPVPLARLYPRNRSVLYFDTRNCVAQMQSLYESGRAGEPTAADTEFGAEFALRERSAMLKHALACWGLSPPQRKSGRVPLSGSARVSKGLERAVMLCAPYDQGRLSLQDEPAENMRIVLENTVGAEALVGSRAKHEVTAQLLDASASGLGLVLPRSDAEWARVGVLVCIYAEEGPDWAIGTIRRAKASSEELAIGVQIFSHRPHSVWLRPVVVATENIWVETTVRERNFDSHYVHAILLTDPPQQANAYGELLLPVGRVQTGTGLDMPLAGGILHMRVSEVRESVEDFARVRVTWLQTKGSSAGPRK